MDYATFFFTNIASATVFTVCIGLLAVYNHRIIGMRWFAAGLVVGLAKLILQGLEGHGPSVLTSMTANELYLVSFGLQLMGLRWFVMRRPLRNCRMWTCVAAVLIIYTVAFIAHVSYTGNLINVPFVAICIVSAWMLWRRGDGQFSAVSHVTSAILCLQGSVAAYRAILTNLHYAQPWATVNAHRDPRWLYSLAAAAFLATIMVMCELWFLVTELQSELAEQASTDPLTGAMNRRAMEQAALRETARSIRSGQALSMMVIDIDRFKLLNDSRGHAAGDRALQALVCRVRSILRQQDSIARTGGEEFAILLPGTTEVDALAVAERVRRAIEALEVPFETGPINFTICAGVAQLDPAGGWEGMMKLADSAMYEAKNRGRNLISARVARGVLISEFRRQADVNAHRYVQAAVGA
jgi:diguanylate cyclase (GGDEF)-like protein